VWTRCADHVTPLYPQKLALTSPTGGGRSVGIVRVRTKATEFSNGVCLGKQSKEKEIRGETKALLRHEQTSSSAGRRHVNVIYIQTKTRT